MQRFFVYLQLQKPERTWGMLYLVGLAVVAAVEEKKTSKKDKMI
jgi:hypothetical protein